MTDPTGPELTEDELSAALKRGVPEPTTPTDLAVGVPRRAQRRRKRRLVALSAAAAVVLVIAIPVGLSSLPSGPGAGGPAAQTPSVTVGKSYCPDGDQDCKAAVAAIRQPLRLPALAPGQSCPVSATRTMKGDEGMSNTVTALGDGPLYLVGPATLRLAKRSTSGPAKGWHEQKVAWLVDRYYTGPLLMRGARIDEPGALRFPHYVAAVGYDKGPGYAGGAGDWRPHRVLVYVRHGVGATKIPASDAYPSYPSGIDVKAPGCYAIQVDGVGFSEQLVFRAR